jgi:hypothetical protein
VQRRVRIWERAFYVSMSVAMVLTVFAGFARTYYLKAYFDNQPLRPIVLVHGLLFTLWPILFLVQSLLIANKQMGIHRRLGFAGGVLMVLMFFVGSATAISSAARGHTPPGGPPPLVFLVIPLGDMLLVPGLVAVGIYYRRRPDVHKRLMLLATIAMLPAAIARLPFEIMSAGPPAFYGLTDLYLVPCLVFDICTRGRPHRATVLGGLAVVLSQPLRLMVANTEAWNAFATWLTSWAA